MTKHEPSGGLSRRAFVGGALAASAAMMLPSAAFAQEGNGVESQTWSTDHKPTNDDLAILRFLAAAELIEDDLWQQYCELAVNNRRYQRALRRIDQSLIRYICDDRDDERSHANLINGYLMSIGEEPVNLDAFRTLPSVPVQGADQNRGRITNLTRLTVDTSWFNRYRGTDNPDFGDQFPQLVDIVGRPTVPTSERLKDHEIQAIAHSASFHFAAIEQGGGSLYTNLIQKVSNATVLLILASIGPTEVYHFSAFHKSLEGIFRLETDGLVFPDLKRNRDLAEAIFPEPATFLSRDLPLTSVIRPSSTAQAGAVAAATGLVQSGLFEGQGARPGGAGRAGAAFGCVAPRSGLADHDARHPAGEPGRCRGP